MEQLQFVLVLSHSDQRHGRQRQQPFVTVLENAAVCNPEQHRAQHQFEGEDEGDTQTSAWTGNSQPKKAPVRVPSQAPAGHKQPDQAEQRRSPDAGTRTPKKRSIAPSEGKQDDVAKKHRGHGRNPGGIEDHLGQKNHEQNDNAVGAQPKVGGFGAVQQEQG